MSQFTQFNLDSSILKLLEEIGFETPTPVQEIAIPKALNGSDLVVSAQTGSGKTGAFLLPSLHLLAKSEKQRAPRILILAPTRELAQQITKESEKFSKHLKWVKTVCIYGGVPYPPQRRALSRPYDILVATPGRLMDHMERGLINLSKVRTVILDEADRMLDMGFLDSVKEITSKCPENKQTLLFSATIDKKILQISKDLQKDAEEITIAPCETRQKDIDQKIYFTDNMSHKMKLLDHFLENEYIERGIIFTSTKRHCDELADRLCDMGQKAEPLHGDMSQRQRSRTVNKLKKNHIDLIVATDVAARGIDIPTLNFVFNIDLPFKPEDYVHRVGRTGRAGAKGTAVTFVSRQDRPMLDKIHKMLDTQIATHTVEGLEPKEKNFAKPKRNRKPFKSKNFRPRKSFSFSKRKKH